MNKVKFLTHDGEFEEEMSDEKFLTLRHSNPCDFVVNGIIAWYLMEVKYEQ